MTDLKTVWITQPSEVNAMSTLAEVRARASRFQTGIRWRNVALYAYSAFSIIVSSWLLARGAFPALKYPMMLMVAAHLLVLWQINRRITARRMPGDMAAQPALDFHREQLEHQARGLSHAWLWYMLPFLVPFLWELAIWLHRIETHAIPCKMDLATCHTAQTHGFISTVLLAICFWTAVLLAFSRAALRVRLQIERLNALKAE
jgi:hypothetical protein